MRRLLTLATFAALALPAAAADDAPNPAAVAVRNGSRVKVPVHAFADLTVPLADGEVVRWVPRSPAPLRFVDRGKGVATIAGQPGVTYEVLYFRVPADAKDFAKVFEPAVVWVEFGKAPAPPKPAPPPAPPRPEPPADPLLAKLKAAYLADPAPAGVKAEALKNRVALYAAATATAADESLLTVGAVLETIGAASVKLDPDHLRGVRAVLRDELAAVFGDADELLDPATRKRLADTFARLAGLLRAVGQ